MHYELKKYIPKFLSHNNKNVKEGASMKRRAKIILLSISVIFVGFAVWFVYRAIGVGEDYRTTLNNSYTRSLSDFVEYLEDMESALEKSKYTATATGQNSIATILMQSATGAKTAVSYLPFNDNNSQSIENSLSVVADFAMYIELKLAKGESLDQEDYENFDILYEHISAIKTSFEEIRNDIEIGELSLGNIDSLINKSLFFPSLPEFDDNISELSTTLSTLPTMIYDGPFSDHIESEEATFLIEKEEITETQAVQIAADFAKVESSSLTLKYVDEGSLASYQFEGENITIKVTKKGGYISYFKKTGDITANNLSYEEALEMAVSHLSEAGYDNMKESYYVINDNLCTINFAPTQDDVIMYPDLIKVTVELGEGEMFEFSATGYLNNHYIRDDIIPLLDEATASENVSENLTIKNINIAVVPTVSLNEALCYEFLCQDTETEREVLVYINGETGMEEQIYIVLESESGKLVM